MGKKEEVGDKSIQPFRLPNNDVHQIEIPLTQTHPLLQYLNRAHQGGERVPDLVSDSGGHLTDRGHPIGSHDLFFHLFNSGDVLKDQDGSDRDAIHILQGRFREPQVDDAAIRSFKAGFLSPGNIFAFCQFRWRIRLETGKKAFEVHGDASGWIDSENSTGRLIHEGHSSRPICGDQPAVKTLNNVVVERLQLIIVHLLLLELLFLHPQLFPEMIHQGGNDGEGQKIDKDAIEHVLAVIGV